MHWFWFLIVLNSVALAVLLWRVLSLRRLALTLQQEVEQLRLAPHDAAPDVVRMLGRGGRPVIALDILNPMELASRQSWFADTFGSMAAPALRKVVYDRAVKIIRQELIKHGVRAQVSIHRVA